MREQEDTEGGEIPTHLLNMSSYNQDQWESLKKRLIKFGKVSGAFTDINVRTFGNTSSDPFQLQFKVRNTLSNIKDVGYGVSQILPILVRIMNASDRTLLLQQPEVHLHPRAQAEFTSLMLETIKSNHNSFIVEMHSDYMIDRARIEIRKGNIKPEDVSLIYLALNSDDSAVDVSNITFDEEANFTDAPIIFANSF